MSNLRRHEDGQIGILMVMILPVIFLIFALALDAGVWFLDHRLAQNQVDAAALAAVQRLPVINTAQATETAEKWLVKNGSGPEDLCDSDENGPFPQYFDRRPSTPDGRFDTVRVCVRRQSPAMFAALGGLSFVYVSAVATATVNSEATPYSIFANHNCPDSSPPSLEAKGSDVTVVGAVHSNCDSWITGSETLYNGPVTYVNDMGIYGANNVCDGYNPCEEGTNQILTQPMPINYTFADVPCDYTNVGLMMDNPDYWDDWPFKTQVKPGVYCNETGKIDLGPGNNVVGTVTLVGHQVAITGQNFNLLPYWNDILIFATGDDSTATTGKFAASAKGDSGDWLGIIYAPNGEAAIEGNGGLSIISSVIADEVLLKGNDFILTGLIGDALSSQIVALIE